MVIFVTDTINIRPSILEEKSLIIGIEMHLIQVSKNQKLHGTKPEALLLNLTHVSTRDLVKL